MTFKDFHSYADYCPVCNSKLILSGEFSVFTWVPTDMTVTPSAFEFELIGKIIYAYLGRNKFIKREYCDFTEPSGASESSQIAMVFDRLVNSFTIGKRIYPHLGKTKLKHLFSPSFVDEIGMRITKWCSVPSQHTYSYETVEMVERDNNNPLALEVVCERLTAYGYSIVNTGSPNGVITFISKLLGIPSNDKIGSTIDLNKIKLPYIPMQGWDLTSKEKLETQIQKCRLLA
jgi:hypothetical protein